MPAPTHLTAVFADLFAVEMAATHLNEGIAAPRRSVRILLTPEQRQALEPREVGTRFGEPVLEEFASVFLETRDASL